MKTDTHKIEYKLQQRHSADHVEVEFSGTLHNQPVTWHAHIRTLHDYCLHELTSSREHDSNTSGIIHIQPFIDISIENNIHRLTVALNLPVIDDAAILRTIIMIRQYKRLKPGRHQYGDIITFRFDTN